jgi:hypothetical protein
MSCEAECGVARDEKEVESPMVRLRSPQAMQSQRPGHAPGLALNFKVDASGCPVLGNFLAVNHHLEFRNARPLHAAHGLGGFGNGILGGFGEALFGISDDFDDFLRHGLPPLVEPEYIAS